MKYEKIRTQVLDAIIEASDLGLIKGTSGNIAVRDEKEAVAAITPSAIAYKTMSAGDIAIVDLQGNWLEGPYKPSSETPMHMAVLRARSDVRATVHTHGMFATIMAMCEEELKAITPPHAEFDPVHTVPFAMSGSEELARLVVEVLGEGRSVLLKNHGMFCCGKSIEAAMEAAIYTEELAQTSYYARLLGILKPMPENAILQMKELIAANHAV